MNALDVLLINTYLFFCNQRDKAVEAFRDEKGAVDIVAIVVMIGIAVAIAVLFRKQIKTLIETLFTNITTKATTAVNADA